MDLNGRVLVLLTHEVNKVVGLGGYVTPTDLYPTTQCTTSNHAEIFYVSVPEAGGGDGGAPNSAYVLAAYRNLLTHEIAHLVQANAYVFGGSGEKTIWEIEGGATLAEQLVAYELFGHGPGQNLGHAQVEQTEESRAWYWSGWIADMVSFFGWDGFGDGSGRVRGAPEECTWIGTEEDGNTGAVRRPAGLRRAVHAPPVRHGSLGRRVSRRSSGAHAPPRELAIRRVLVARGGERQGD